jgi:Cu2+-exporting ATPase
MTCCTAASDLGKSAPTGMLVREEFTAAAYRGPDGALWSRLSVPGIHCGGCIQAIEQGLIGLDEVEAVRVNLAQRSVTLRWANDRVEPEPVLEALNRCGYAARIADGDIGQRGKDPVLSRLLTSLAVSGFAAANIMLLSVSVWSGADGVTRDMFHWISALIALPAIAYAGRPFFEPALAALRCGRLNMDVPIALAVILAAGMSLFETWTGGAHAYFDAATTLLFFLLIGRTLDHLMRARARGAVDALSRLVPRGAVRVDPAGERSWISLSDIGPGARLEVSVGERVPADGVVVAGQGGLDLSIVTGESRPVVVEPGLPVTAGALVMDASMIMEATKTAQESFVEEMRRMLDAAEGTRPRMRRLADWAASIYAPVVHIAALLTVVGWMLFGSSVHDAVLTGVAVLIITCPCALGLAVPIVQVIAAGRLFRAGVMLRDGAALEALAGVDHVVFDKTGTLTSSELSVHRRGEGTEQQLDLAAALARSSGHPVARAIARLYPVSDIRFDRFDEVSGQGVEGWLDGDLYRLGRPEWALTDGKAAQSGTVFSRNGRLIEGFECTADVRQGAEQAISALRREGLGMSILSGDHADAVGDLAARLEIDDWQARLTPADKVAQVRALQDQGKRVLVVGDGINDAPALAAADVSMAPGTAADVSRSAAGLVFLGESLEALPAAVSIAKRSRVLIFENFGLAVLYNLVAVPLAALGFATPLVAALAMSGSSILVVANALRLHRLDRKPAPFQTAKTRDAVRTSLHREALG